MDALALPQEHIVCAIVAAVKYEVPANILLAVAEKEGGKPGQWSKNANGSYDVGPMQLNTTYLQDLQKYGIAPKDVERGCYGFDLAAWRIRGHLKHDKGDMWTNAANYHSRSPRYNRIYRQDLQKKAGRWQHWLEAHFATYAVADSTASKVYLHATQPSVHNNDSVSSDPQQKIMPGYFQDKAKKSLERAFAHNKTRKFQA